MATLGPLLLAVCAAASPAVPAPRRVRVRGRGFVLTATNASVVLAGPNVVVKGPPYLPSVSGTTHCHDVNTAACSAAGTCQSCETFNEADVALIKSQGRNFIRLGVVWAGAQPQDTDALDPAFLERLHVDHSSHVVPRGVLTCTRPAPYHHVCRTTPACSPVTATAPNCQLAGTPS